MKYDIFKESFRKFIDECPEEKLDENERYIFLSDLHMGNGSKRDDLEVNRELIETMLERWYLERNYYLILNGDIEDVSKFPLLAIRTAWPRLLSIFARFAEKGRLRKITGNHDFDLAALPDYPWPLYAGLVYRAGQNRIFVFHGHQASSLYVKFDFIPSFFIRYFLRPLNIRNSGVSKDSRRRFATERRIYRAARTLGIATITGHTHRPLFESMSKYDNIRLRIEEILFSFVDATAERKEAMRNQMLLYRAEIQKLLDVKAKEKKTQSLYGIGPFLIPCFFNSGCATGKKGLNALEIENGEISLVYWTGSGTTRPYIANEALDIVNLDGRFSRYTLQREHLENIFTRIDLLSDVGTDNEYD